MIQSKSQIYVTHKPVGKTTYDMVRLFKREFTNPKPKKIGHFGTLDPFAEGLVFIGVNGACRLNNWVQEFVPKTYRALGLWGTQTDTQDNTGKELQSDPQWMEKLAPWMEKGPKALEEFFQTHLLGEILQIPSAFSALKFEGIPLYKYARQGQLISKDARSVFIYELKIVELLPTGIKFEAKVSSGTYIRSLFEQMAQLLGTYGHLQELSRIEMGKIRLQDFHDRLSEKTFCPIPLEDFLDFPKIYLSQENQILDFSQGRRVHLSSDTLIKKSSIPSTMYYIIDQTNTNENCLLKGLGEFVEKNIIQPKIVLE